MDTKKIKLIFQIFILGIIILASAIIINLFADFFGITTWYDFLKGDERILEVNLISLLFLLIFYPLFLGTTAYYTTKGLTKWLK
jgi:hypothetical protein